MTCYVIAFEVASAERKSKLESKIKGYKTYCPINENCWAIVTEEKAPQVRDKLMAEILTTDKIFVIKSGTEAAWRNAYGTDNSEWLKNHL